MIDTKKLRQRILDLAIRGKLVPQDPNDEPASVLLDRIRAEKERLIAEGKIKRSKKKASTDDKSHYQHPFEIPQSWEWVRLGEIAQSNIGLTYKPSDVANKGIPVLRSNNIQDRKIVLDELVRVTSNILEKQYVNDGDLLICARNGSRRLVGKCAIIGSLNEPMSFGAFMAICRSPYNPWIFQLLNSEYFNRYLDASNSTSICQVTQSMLLDFLVPFPPVNEQERIIREINHFSPLIDALEGEIGCLTDQISSAKSKILELAITGKLVPQNPDDEPASALLERINPKAEIVTDNAQHRKLPYGWAWIKGKYLFKPMKSTRPEGDTFLYVDIDSIDNKTQRLLSPKIVETKKAPSRASRYTQAGDVVFSMVRPYLRNIALINHENLIASTGFFVCSPLPVLSSDYLYFLMTSDYVVEGLNQFMKGDNSPSINSNHILDWCYPVPPLEEQARIVSQANLLFEILNDIKNSLEA